MYAKRQLSKRGYLNFFLFEFWEFIFYLKISHFHFLWKKKEKEFPGNSNKVLKKIAGMLY